MASSDREKAILQRVGKGGFWHSEPLDYSKETQDRLSEVMKEAKLTLTQQREMRAALKNDPKPSTFEYKKQFRGKNPFVGNSSRKSPPLSKGNYGIRSKETIIKSGCYKVEKLTSVAHLEKPVREKEKLQNLMAFGKDLVSKEKNKSKTETKTKTKAYPTTRERFDQVVEEIEERRQFLNEMKKLGVENQYSTIINSQLAEKLHELELLNQETNKPKAIVDSIHQ